MRRDGIAEFVARCDILVAKLDFSERASVIAGIKERLNVNAESDAPWDSMDAPDGVQRADGWKLIPVYIGNRECFVFSSGAKEVWKFMNGDDLLQFLKESPSFEYYVCDVSLNFLVCNNDHDNIIGWGWAESWVSSLVSET